MARLDSDLLRSFVAVADGGSVSAGALQVGRTQSAVSMQMRKLEEQVGQALLIRGSRGVAPTAAGEALLAHSREILTLLERAEASLSADPLSGRVRIGLPEEFGSRLLPAVLARFAGTHAEVEVTVHCEASATLEARLAAKELDLAVLVIDGGRPRGRLLAHDPTLWVASDQHRPELCDPLPLAMYGPDCWWTERALKSLDDQGRRYRIAYTSRSVAGIQAAVTAGLAVAVMAESTMPPHSRRLDRSQGFMDLPGSSVVLRLGRGGNPPSVQGMAAAVETALREPGFGAVRRPAAAPAGSGP